MAAIQLLIDNLTEITLVNQEVYRMALEKKEVLIAGDIEKLAGIVNEEGASIRRLGRLEEKRQEIVAQLVEELQLEKQEVSFTNLIAAVTDPNVTEKLQQIFQELTKVIADLQEINDLNQQMIQQSLDYVNLTIDLVQGSQDEQLYSKPGNEDGSEYAQPARSILDLKA